MNTVPSHRLNQQYTVLSDRFRSLWTFYQFLGGIFKHQQRGEVPFSYDFQTLYRRMQNLVPLLVNDPSPQLELELREIDRELQQVHGRLREIQAEFTPSLLRKLFDHLQRQDEKILFALAKFYLQYDTLDVDTVDKLDILLTRLAESPAQGARALPRNETELRQICERLAEFAGVEEVDPMERSSFVLAVQEFRGQIEAVSDFETLLTGGLFDRYRRFKHGLGTSYLDPEIMAEIVKTNISAKNKFQELYQFEEASILEDTNRIFEIERYLEKNPEAADEALREHIESFRRFRSRFDNGRKKDNLKRENLLELRRSMQDLLDRFEPLVKGIPRTAAASPQDTGAAERPSFAPNTPVAPLQTGDVQPSPYDEPNKPAPRAATTASLGDIIPADTLLNESLHRMMFALELVVWDYPPEDAVARIELANLELEPWEVEAYRQLSEHSVTEGTSSWELAHFFLTSAALRIKMNEEDAEIRRLTVNDAGGRLFEVLESSAQSLERARDVDRRFQWFVDDMLYRGETEKLEQMYRSRYRFLYSYSRLWLDHQSAGGITPL